KIITAKAVPLSTPESNQCRAAMRDMPSHEPAAHHTRATSPWVTSTRYKSRWMGSMLRTSAPGGPRRDHGTTLENPGGLHARGCRRRQNRQQFAGLHMLIDFFFALRQARVPVSIPEYLSLIEAIKAEVIEPSVDQFYHLARLSLVKNEAHFDKFDRAFSTYFKGVSEKVDLTREIPLEWLKKRFERELSAADKAAIEAM